MREAAGTYRLGREPVRPAGVAELSHPARTGRARLVIVDVYASQPNYWRHLEPVAHELRARGHDVRSTASRHARPWGPRATRWGGSVLLVASALDATQPGAREHSAVVYLEHGAGQSYVDAPFGYAGGERLDHVRLFLAPSEHVAATWRARYPQARAEAVGCAALDRHVSHPSGRTELGERAAAAQTPRGASGPPLVAVAQHWRCGNVPETMPAVPRFTAVIAAQTERAELLAHAHPRVARRAGEAWARAGVRFEPDPDAVLVTLRDAIAIGSGAVLVADNTSMLYEAAALGLPVLALNLPTYRRDVEHGLRFWSHVPGLQCDEPTEFRERLEVAIADPLEAQELRARAAAYAYCAADGRAAARAADAIEEHAWKSRA